MSLGNLKVCHISTSSLFDLKRVTCLLYTVIISTKFEPDITIHIPLPSYSILAADTLCDLVTLTVHHLTLDSGHT